MNQEKFVVLEEDEGVRLDVYVAEQFEDFSRSYIQKLIKDQQVRVNGSVEKNRYLVKTGDEIVIEIPAAKVLEVEAEPMELSILFEDEHLLVVDKPKGMVVHPAAGNESHTLVNGLMFHCRGQLSSINGIIRPGIVHRIDKDTSGLLMVAKTNQAHHHLAEQLKNHAITRRYQAIAVGNIKDNQFTVDAPIGRHPVDRLKMSVLYGGRNAITHIRVLERYGTYTYVEAQLETGRTHQIRVHLSYLQHPLLGDELYGGKTGKFNLKGQTLHAKVLGFLHPASGEYLEFESPLPEYFQKLLTFMRNAK